MERDRIFVIHTIFIENGELKRQCAWGYYFDYISAEKAVLENHTDIYECGYYNYAVIAELKPGTVARIVNFKSQKWFIVEYKENDPDPKVTPCKNPLINYIFTL